MSFEKWFNREWGGFDLSDPIDKAVHETAKAAYEAGQRDMRERAADACDTVQMTASGDKFDGAFEVEKLIRAIKLESEL